MFFVVWEMQYDENGGSYRNWWLAASSWQCAYSCIISHAEFIGETSNYPGDSAPLQTRFGTLWLLAFSKLKSPLKGKRFQTIGEIQENTMGHLTVIPTKGFAECFEQRERYWENCVRSQDAYFEGDWGNIVPCMMFLVSFIFFNKYLYFSYYMAGYFLDRPRTLIKAESWQVLVFHILLS